MDYAKLAEFLFPHIKKTISDYEKQYPKRKLAAGAEVTRFAPSPTGYLHIGSFLSAFMDYQIARVSDGVFMFRLEDTDGKREVEGSGLVAIKVLNDYGIIFNEGISHDGKQFGDYGPYIQSQRKEIYQTFAKHLVAAGKAFPCFCDKAEDKAEILDRRERQLKEGSTLEDHDVCRNLTIDEIMLNLKNNKPFAIRLKSTGDVDKKLQIYDEIKGARELSENTKDAVLLKSDGIPPYAFAHVVDDYLMQVTLVVRGEEWYPSLPLHLEIFNAFGIKPVRYAHTPVICKTGENGNKRKISKRLDNEADMRYFEGLGYPKQALLEYLLTLANSNFEEWRRDNPDASWDKFIFSVAKISNSNPMFDIDKLNDISKNIIANYSAEDVYRYVLTWAEVHDAEFYGILKANKAKAIEVFAIDRYTPNPRKDIAKWQDVKGIYNYMFFPYEAVGNVQLLQQFDKAIIKKVIADYAAAFDDNWEKADWMETSKEIAKIHNFCLENRVYKATPHLFSGNLATFFTILRVVITGRSNSPDLYSICKVLGKQEIQKRVALISALL